MKFSPILFLAATFFFEFSHAKTSLRKHTKQRDLAAHLPTPEADSFEEPLDPRLIDEETVIGVDCPGRVESDAVNAADSIYGGAVEGGAAAMPILRKPPKGDNPCKEAIEQTGPQSGTNVTLGYQGDRDVEKVPITVPYWKAGLCPVNVHWHLGAEHYSLGEYDETGSGPTDVNAQRRLAGVTRQGYQCKSYDPQDEKFTKPYNWKFCTDMQVGQTYEVHWPHSAAGACGTLNQYQTPFYDGVFCNGDLIVDTATQIGVQAQVFVVVNDESYFYPDLMRGMIVDLAANFGESVAKYTGSTTGTSVNNELCSQYTPITWQVDRKCHMINASSFDMLCMNMLAQRADMSDDIYPHGSRELVSKENAPNNFVHGEEEQEQEEAEEETP